MQTENRLLDDLARVASGALHTLAGLREEMEMRVRERLERFATEINLVTREEFEAVRALAQRAREEQEALAARLAALEAELAELRAQARRRLPGQRARDQAKPTGPAEGAGAPEPTDPGEAAGDN